MKKIFCILLTTAAVLAVSCGKEPVPATDENPAAATVQWTFRAQAPVTPVVRTSIGSVSGSSATVVWDADDEITVYYLGAGNEPKSVTAAPDAAGASATFTVSLPAGDNPDHFWAVYPAGSGTLTYDESVEKFTITVKSGDGTFKKANYMAAYTTATAKTFAFKHAVGLIKLSLPDAGTITHGATDYVITNVRIKGKETSVQSMGTVDVTTDGSAVNGFGTTVDGPTANTRIVGLSDAVRSQGVVYLPSLPGELTNGFSIRYESAEGPIPAVVTKDQAATVSRGHILPIADLTSGIQWDYYVSPDGTGDGKTAATPMSLAAFRDIMNVGANFIYGANRLDGATFHFSAETYTLSEPLTIPSFKDAVHLFLEGPGAVLDGGGSTSLLKFTGASLQFKAKGFTLQNGNAANGAAINIAVGTVSDEGYIVDFEDCIIKDNTATASGGGGAVLVATGVRNGQLRFNNCSFTGNKATHTTGNGGVLYTNAGTMACLFNKCSFKGNTGTTNGMQLYLNNGAARLGMNNCTVNAGTLKLGNGSAIACKGYSVIANSTIWSSSSGMGNWGQIALGCAISNSEPNGSRVVNCLVKNKDATYASFYLHGSYNQYVDYCLYTPVKKSAADIDTYTIANSLEIADDEMGTKSEKSVAHNSVSKIYYTFTADYSTGMTFATLDQVRASIQSAANVGPLLLSWLDTIPGALTTDITGYDRAANASHPGSWQKR